MESAGDEPARTAAAENARVALVNMIIPPQWTTGGFVLPAIKFDRRVGKVTIRVFTPTCLIGARLSQILVSMMKRSGSALNRSVFN
jgi:hypothetical protein